MEINDYIIRGGENLNAAPLKTRSFPSEAEQIFNEWHTKLGKDDKEKENYFEIPVNDQYRLFIRSFYIEKEGNRPICFYIGLLIPRAVYIEAKDYYCIHKGLCHLSFAKIQNAAMASFLPIEITTEWPTSRTPIGLNFKDLSKMRLYGDKEFASNIDQMCSSISINKINDWFSRLFIAVNPYRLNRAFHIVISREPPRPPIPDDPPIPSPIQNQHQKQSAERKVAKNTATSHASASNTQDCNKVEKLLREVIFILKKRIPIIVILVLCVVVLCVNALCVVVLCVNASAHQKEISDLRKEIFDLRKEISDLRKNINPVRVIKRDNDFNFERNSDEKERERKGAQFEKDQ